MSPSLLQNFYVAEPVTVSLSELEAGLSSEILLNAFGPNSLGILLVTGLPPLFSTLRSAVLPYGSLIPRLPAAELAKLESPERNYIVGWSCGRERLSPTEPRDALKGSYYWSCLHPELGLASSQTGNGGSEEGHNLSGWIPNILPPPPYIPRFGSSMDQLCGLIIRIGTSVARACDAFAQSHINGYIPGTLETILKESRTHRARLLHYFPPPTTSTQSDSAGAGPDQVNIDSVSTQFESHVWCSPHLDHGCLTGLTGAEYVDESQATFSASVLRGETSPCLKSVAAPLPSAPAGLFIIDRHGRAAKVLIPPHALAFQTGEALERITRGQLKAVKHFVVSGGGTGNNNFADGGSSGNARIARNTLAVFMQPNEEDVVVHPDDPTGDGTTKTFKQFSHDILTRNYR